MSRWSSLRLAKKVSISTSGLVASIVVGEDSLYVADRQDDIVKLDRKTLRPMWRKPAGKYSPSFLISDVVVLKTIGARLKALRQATGETAWEREPFNSVSAWRGQILFSSGSSLEILEPSTGQVVRSIVAPPVVAAGGQLCAEVLLCGHPSITAFDMASGQILWERDIMAEMRTHGADEEGEAMGLACGSLPASLIATRDGMTFGYSLEDGRIRWGARAPVPHRIPMVRQGRVYVAYLERFIALDEASGDVIYDVTHPELKDHPKHGTAYRAKTGTVYGDTLAVPHESGHLAIYNLQDGSLRWLHMSKAPLWSSAEADGRLFVGTGDGKLLVFEPSEP